MAKIKGTVKWFNEAKGFGFITPADGTKDVFVHVSDVQRSGLQGLNEGDKIDFETVETAVKTETAVPLPV